MGFFWFPYSIDRDNVVCFVFFVLFVCLFFGLGFGTGHFSSFGTGGDGALDAGPSSSHAAPIQSLTGHRRHRDAIAERQADRIFQVVPSVTSFRRRGRHRPWWPSLFFCLVFVFCVFHISRNWIWTATARWRGTNSSRRVPKTRPFPTPWPSWTWPSESGATSSKSSTNTWKKKGNQAKKNQKPKEKPPKPVSQCLYIVLVVIYRFLCVRIDT